jgi:hypothetical protein
MFYLFLHVHRRVLINNKLESVRNSTLEGLNFLRELNLMKNRISLIESGAFSHTKDLERMSDMLGSSV